MLSPLALVGWLALTRLGLEGESHFLIYLALFSALLCTAFGVTFGIQLARIRLLAERDDLTGLFNQSAFMRTAGFLLHLAIRHSEPLAVMMLDIDHFKNVNDQHNHLVGSYVLKKMAELIVESTRKSDLTARFGGDEYIFCLPRTDLKHATDVAERVRSRIASVNFMTRGHSVKVTVSIGVAVVKAVPGLELNRLVELADQALYTAKDQGRNRVVTLSLNV